MIQDSGAFCEVGTILGALFTRRMAAGVYAFDNVEAHCASVVTNTTPVVAYRGAGRPEATAATERAMDSSPPKSEWTPQRFAARTSSHRSMSRTPPQLVRPTTWATSSAVDRPWSTLVTRIFGPSRHNVVPTVHRSCLALVSRTYVEITGGAGAPEEGAKIIIHPDGNRHDLHRYSPPPVSDTVVDDYKCPDRYRHRQVHTCSATPISPC